MHNHVSGLSIHPSIHPSFHPSIQPFHKVPRNQYFYVGQPLKIKNIYLSIHTYIPHNFYYLYPMSISHIRYLS